MENKERHFFPWQKIDYEAIYEGSRRNQLLPQLREEGGGVMTEYIVETVGIDEFHQEIMYEAICEEIVRCRDCKHFTPRGTYKFENGVTNNDFCKYVRGWFLQITLDGFCAWGERKDKE